MVKQIKMFLLKESMKKNKTPWIKVQKDVISKYRETTHKNKLATDDEIELKIVRAFYSGSYDSINDERTIKQYGYLTIIRDNKRNIITYISNDKKLNRNGKIDFRIKDGITGIYNSVFGGNI